MSPYVQKWFAQSLDVVYTCTTNNYDTFWYLRVVVDVGLFNIVLFSALEQTRCVVAACDSKWVTSFFEYPPECDSKSVTSFFNIYPNVILNDWLAFLNIHPRGILTTLFCCYMSGARWNCCRLGLSSVYTIQSCTMTRHLRVTLSLLQRGEGRETTLFKVRCQVFV